MYHCRRQRNLLRGNVLVVQTSGKGMRAGYHQFVNRLEGHTLVWPCLSVKPKSHVKMTKRVQHAGGPESEKPKRVGSGTISQKRPRQNGKSSSASAGS